MQRTPRLAKLALYSVFGLVLAVILAGLMTKIVPGKLGVTISRNSEGFLTVLAICGWIDVVRPRLALHPRQWQVTGAVAALLVVGGLLLRASELPSRFRTLNEAVLGVAVLIVYLQLRRPLPVWAIAALPVLAIAVAAIGQTNAFTTDMAETFGAMVLVPLVVDVVDARLLRGGSPRVARNLGVAVALIIAIVVIHAVTPKPPDGVVENITYYVQRTTEMFIAAAAMLVYYATRRPRGLKVGHADRRTPATAVH